uniref:Uncharacterized protein n=1 Tax=Alexandrium catenella TaxID=2925 RepID=A0A7S1RMT9_ALECA|mmetsp:Transcript_65415/g.174298  ORF Transcript_65415/g.174298 Transcript_65415/m.174298 type:complete len:300 (+) Transcript_65415:96-995(+)
MAEVTATGLVEGPDGVEADGEEKSSSDEEMDAMRLTPSYHFPAEFHLEFQGSRIEVIRHLCQRHPAGTRAVVLFFPGVHGGVGPCRQPGETFDENALFATVAQGLTSRPDSDIDCYRCSWPYMRPRMGYAVGGACRVLHHALLEATKGADPEDADRDIQIFIVGHSLGGAVAIQSSEVIARHFGADGRGGQKMEGLERVYVRVAGVCTLNGALDVRQVNTSCFGSLSGSRALFICGDADQCVPPQTTRDMYEALPIGSKRLLELPGGSHDLFTFKEQLVAELTSFILEGLGDGRAQEAA